MSESRGALYTIRWEILVMAAALIISAVVVLAIPNDFTAKMLQQQKAQKEAEKSQEIGHEEHGELEGAGKNMTGMNFTDMKP